AMTIRLRMVMGKNTDMGGVWEKRGFSGKRRVMNGMRRKMGDRRKDMMMGKRFWGWSGKWRLKMWMGRKRK
ncbi:hypothetical protein, partial [Neisseria sicca]|uniref:hypothetical protein n=1 Tax=Neisseria sicca TaxID=490 RepID=UPI00164A0C2A